MFDIVVEQVVQRFIAVEPGGEGKDQLRLISVVLEGPQVSRPDVHPNGDVFLLLRFSRPFCLRGHGPGRQHRRGHRNSEHASPDQFQRHSAFTSRTLVVAW